MKQNDEFKSQICGKKKQTTGECQGIEKYEVIRIERN